MGQFGDSSDGDDASGGDKTTVIVSLNEMGDRGKSKERLVPILRVARGVETGRHFIIPDNNKMVLGRSSECTIVIPDASCSRKHAEIFLASNGKVFVKDLGSTNGTLLNGKRIPAPQELNESDIVQIGDNTEFLFEHMREEEAQAQVEIYDKATRDTLTRTYNRRFFEDTINREIEQRNKDHSGIALVIFDIDHFKPVNDTHGHQAGDAVLREMGARIPGAIRGEDIFARIGGEEFAIILRTDDASIVPLMAERIRVLVESKRFAAEGKELPISISVGTCYYKGPNPVSFDRLYKIADEALYESKHNGRNRCTHKPYTH
jgi:two-component system, cell cycle response regulator